MKLRTRFFMNVGGLATVGIFFIGIGAYLLSTSLGVHSSAHGLVAGGASILGGVTYDVDSVSMGKSTKNKPKTTRIMPLLWRTQRTKRHHLPKMPKTTNRDTCLGYPN